MPRGKTDNSSESKKLAVRGWVASHFDDWRVLDLYCGRKGKMYQGIWHKAKSYLGTDKNMPHKLAPTIKLTAEMAVQALDLDVFNIFDVDCYSSPWIVARRILRKRGSGKFGLVLTSGEHRGLDNGNSNEAIRATLGLSGFSDLRLLGRYYDLVMGLMVGSLTELATLTEGVYAQQARTNHFQRYIGLIVEKT